MLLLDKLLAFQVLPWCQPDNISSVCHEQSRVTPVQGSFVLQGRRAAPVQRKSAGGFSCVAESCANCSLLEKLKCSTSTCMDLLEVVCPENWRENPRGTISLVSITHFLNWCPAPSRSWIPSAGEADRPSILRILMRSVLKLYKHRHRKNAFLCLLWALSLHEMKQRFSLDTCLRMRTRVPAGFALSA